MALANPPCCGSWDSCGPAFKRPARPGRWGDPFGHIFFGGLKPMIHSNHFWGYNGIYLYIYIWDIANMFHIWVNLKGIWGWINTYEC